MSKITVETTDMEQGGGEALYIVEVLIDGVKALHLQRWHFKEDGQMEAFAEALREAGSREQGGRRA